ncbi:MAG: M28 family peptidase [bacterium]|nr:M28 family peptidase [bacterium]
MSSESFDTQIATQVAPQLAPVIGRHLHKLVGEIGPRPVGSVANNAASDYIESVFKSAGLETQKQRFEWPTWAHVASELRLGERRLNVEANPFSPSCDVTAPIAAASTLAELRAAQLNGRIALLYGELAKETIWPKHNPIMLPENHRLLIELLETGQPAAVLMVHPRLGQTLSQIEDADFTIPSAMIDPEAGVALLNAGDEPVSLRLETHTSPGYGYQVIAHKRGSSPSKIVLCAHFDTKFNTPGAVDNGGGIATLLALAEALAGQTFAPTLEFVAWNNEEYYGSTSQYALSDTEYMAQNEDMSGIIAAINLDGAGQTLGTNTLAQMRQSEAFTVLVDEVLAAYPGVARVEPWYASNHYTYFKREVPSVAISSEGVDNLGHYMTDVEVWVSPVRLAEAAQVVIDLLGRLADKAPAWTRSTASSTE